MAGACLIEKMKSFRIPLPRNVTLHPTHHRAHLSRYMRLGNASYLSTERRTRIGRVPAKGYRSVPLRSDGANNHSITLLNIVHEVCITCFPSKLISKIMTLLLFSRFQVIF
jgi:hypothetical protein